MRYRFKFKDEAGYYETEKSFNNQQEIDKYIKEEWRDYQGLCISFKQVLNQNILNNGKSISSNSI